MATSTHIARTRPIGGVDIGRCLTRIHHDRFTPGTFEPDAVTARLFAAGNAHEDRVLDALRSGYEDVLQIEAGAGAAEASLAAMDRRVPILLGARLEDHTGTRVGLPDILVWVGDGYAPVDVKFHKVIGDKGRHGHATAVDDIANRDGRLVRFRTGRVRDLLQTAHYWALLDELGHASSERIVGIIGSEEPYECVWVALDGDDWSLLDDLDDYWKSADSVVSHGIAHPEQPLVPPAFTSECGRCPWTEKCVDEMKAIDDPTLLRGVSPTARDRLHRDSGISTIREIASLDLESELVDSSSVVARARAYTASRLLRSDAGKGPLPLPSAPLEVDFDIETHDGGRIYLAGLLITDSAGSRFEPVADWSGTPMGERQLLIQLFEKLSHFGEAGVPVFHWTDYEPRTLAAGAERHGLSLGDAPTVEAWFDEHAVDLCAWSRRHLTSPDGYGLKVIAPLCGFEWRDDDPGGLQSEIWFEAMREGDAAMRSRILEYNEDDVAAQLAVRRWVRANDNGSGPGSAISSMRDWPIA